MAHRRLATLGFALALTLFSAAPVVAQIWFFPDYALPFANGSPTTWVAGSYGRGLNSALDWNALGAVLGRAGERVSFAGAFGYLTDGDGEFTAGGAIGVDLVGGEGPGLSVQGGLGWMEPGTDLTALRIPIGLALRSTSTSGPASVTPWIMPRINIVHVSGSGGSETETDFGASGGISITWSEQFGVHTALDMLKGDRDTLWQLGIGIHAPLGR